MRECFYCQSDQDSVCFHAPPLGGVVMCQTWNRLCPFLTGGSFFVWPWEPWSDMLEPASTPSDDACLYIEQCAGALQGRTNLHLVCMTVLASGGHRWTTATSAGLFYFHSDPFHPPPTFTVISPCVCICERGCVCGQFGPPRCLFVFPLECGWCAVSPAKRGDSGWGDTKRTLEIKADRRRERRDRKEYQHGVIPAHLALDA